MIATIRILGRKRNCGKKTTEASDTMPTTTPSKPAQVGHVPALASL